MVKYWMRHCGSSENDFDLKGPTLPDFLSEPLEAALRGPDQTRGSLPSACNAVEEFIRTLMAKFLFRFLFREFCLSFTGSAL